jgi:four helix bundle protein
VNLNVNATLHLVKQPSRARADMAPMLSFQKLHVYQRSIEFLALTIELIRGLPKGHAELADQLLRAAQSQPRNIAEGAGRRSAVDQARFYAIARGSAMESAAVIDTLRVMSRIEEQQYVQAMELLEAIVAMLTRMTDR